MSANDTQIYIVYHLFITQNGPTDEKEHKEKRHSFIQYGSLFILLSEI